MKPMRFFTTGLVVLAASSFLAAQRDVTAGTQAAASPVNWTGTHQVGVPDPVSRMTAYTLKVPDGWHFGADVLRGEGCHGWGVNLNYMMNTPDNLTAIIQLAGVRWHWDNDQWKDDHGMRSCEAVEISSAADFVINVLLPEVRPKAKIVSVIVPTAEQQRSLDEGAEAEMQMYVGWARQRGGDPPEHVYLDAVDVRLEYEINGHPVEEMVTSVIDCHGGMNRINYHPRYPPVTELFCSSRPEHIIRAPKGQLDAMLAAPEVKALRQSVQVDPQWWDWYSNGVRAKMAQDVQTSNALIAGSWATFNRQQAENQRFYDQLNENSRIFNQNMIAEGQRNLVAQQNHNIAMDREAHRWINFAGDKADYYNPNSGQMVTLSNKYSRTFFSPDGREAIQTNGWNPNSAPGSSVWNESSQPH